MVVDDSEISNNGAGKGGDEGGNGGAGGGIYCAGPSSLAIYGSNICGNTAGKGRIGGWGGGEGGDGGGIWADWVGAIGCKIWENRTGDGGGQYRGNRAADGGAGGGVYCGAAVLVDCSIMKNATGWGGSGGDPGAPAGGDGGSGAGLHCSGEALVADCVFVANNTGAGGWGYNNPGGDGGSGAAIFSDSGSVFNCLIAGNRTGDGGCGEEGGAGGSGAGICLGAHSLSSVKHCTVFGNSTGDGGQYGSIVYGPRGKGGGVCGGGGTVITDSIIWGNSPEQLFGLDCDNVSYCDIGDDECAGSVGNISADPLFVQPGYWANANDPNIVVEPNDPNAVWIIGDYHLNQIAAGQAADSPCVDAGSDTAVNLGMDKFTTRTDKVWDEGIVDMGYHYPIPSLGDIDGDGDVDLMDYAIFAGHWLKLVIMEIPMGEVVVDGNLSEWSQGVEWIALDKVYYGNPDDVSEAKYALRWDPDTDKIYAAVVVTDSDHVFSDEYIKWNASDRIEIYSQGDAEGGTGWVGTYDVAQQYMMGPNDSGGSWATWALGETLAEDAGVEYAVTVDGNQIIHEGGVLMFDSYGGFSGGESIVTDLRPGLVVGFDILASTRWVADGFGMLSENLMTGKSGNASQFAKYTLVEQLSDSSSAPVEVDLDKNGIVDWFDLALLAGNWLAGL